MRDKRSCVSRVSLAPSRAAMNAASGGNPRSVRTPRDGHDGRTLVDADDTVSASPSVFPTCSRLGRSRPRKLDLARSRNRLLEPKSPANPALIIRSTQVRVLPGPSKVPANRRFHPLRAPERAPRPHADVPRRCRRFADGAATCGRARPDQICVRYRRVGPSVAVSRLGSSAVGISRRRSASTLTVSFPWTP